MKKLTKNGIAFFNSRRSSSKKRGNFSSYSHRFQPANINPMDKHSARYCAQWLPGCTFLFTRFADRNIVARARNIKRKRGKDITHRERRGKFAWLFYAPRTKHFNVGLERKHREREMKRIPNDVSTTPSCLSIIASLYDLSISAPARNNDWAQFACETSHYIPPLYLVRPRPRVKTSKRLSTLILDLSFLFF